MPSSHRDQNRNVIFPIFWILLLVFAGAGGLLIWQFWPSGEETGRDPSAEPRKVTAKGSLAEAEKTTIQLFQEVSPSVVNITKVSSRTNLFTFDVYQIPEGTGSGFIWNPKGHIVTNYHVIQDAQQAYVTLQDGSRYRAKVVGSYPDKDLAVLWIDAPKDRLQPIAIGTSDDLKVGQATYAIGNPFGLDQTLTTGVISAVDRKIQSVTKRPIEKVIQTDAAINPGNSGGPLLDSSGRMIGVNTAIASPSGAFAGIGFAIPVNEVNRVVPEIIRKGKVTRPYLGVEVASDNIARRLNVSGVLILNVQPDSPADEAGLQGTQYDADNNIQLGDVIVAIDGKKIRKVDDLLSALEEHAPGEVVDIKVRRGNKTQEISVTLKERNWET